MIVIEVKALQCKIKIIRKEVFIECYLEILMSIDGDFMKFFKFFNREKEVREILSILEENPDIIYLFMVL